jgi:hypothetical protein
MSPRRHLLVAIHDRSWGRTEIAVRVARELRARGDEPRFLIHTSAIPLLQGTGFDYEPVADHLWGLVRLLLDTQVQQIRPESVIYFDFFNTCNYLLQLGIEDSEFLVGYDCPIASLDTWDYARTGHRFDLFGKPVGSLALGDKQAKIAQFSRIPYRLIPVPIAACDRKPGKFACLPTPSPEIDRNYWRSQLGIPKGDRIILFCTSDWQELRGDDASGRRVSGLLPKLIAEYVKQLGSIAHLVHVGPKAYDLDTALAGRYHWHPPLGRTEFERMMAGSDLLLSANISATTVAWAMQLQVPVVVLRNSQTLERLEDAERVATTKLSRSVLTHLGEALPIYPFSLWPLGYYDFLRPILEDNSYCQTFEAIEIVDEQAVVGACDRLLNDELAREAMSRRQMHYVQQVRALPTAAEVIDGFLG